MSDSSKCGVVLRGVGMECRARFIATVGLVEVAYGRVRFANGDELDVEGRSFPKPITNTGRIILALERQDPVGYAAFRWVPSLRRRCPQASAR